MVYSGAIVPQDNNNNTTNGLSLSTRLQDFLICIEMFMAAIAHHYSFSYLPYQRSDESNRNWCRAFLAMWDVSDVGRDIQEHLGIVGK